MKKVVISLLTIALTATLIAPVCGGAYQDIPAGSSLAEDVQKAVDYGLMNGYNDAAFGYGDSMTRAQFVAVLVRMMGWAVETPTVPTFTDVPAAHSWYGAVETAAVYDAVDGWGTFRPGDPVTRGEMAEMLVRALGLKGAAQSLHSSMMPHSDTYSILHGGNPFTDLPWREEGYIAVAYAIGMANGTSATTFSPNSTATRAQAAAMLVRIYEKLQQKTAFRHGFYAISSHDQLELARGMDAVSVGWSRMTLDGFTARLSTTSADGNEFYIPSGYDEVVSTLEDWGTAVNLNVYMDLSGGAAGLLGGAQIRSQAVAEIVNELTVSYKALGHNPYNGVTIDFEGLFASQREDFTAFLTELADEVHALGKTLYVCVSPVLSGPGGYNGYDYRAIGDLADKVILMAYDYDARNLIGFDGTEYYKTTAPAPIDQVYLAMKALKNQVSDGSKIVLGFSNKNVAWEIDENGKLISDMPLYPSNETMRRRLMQADTIRGWSNTYQSPYAVYTTEDGKRYFVWYEDNQSVRAKQDTAKLLGIHGISLWRLGAIPLDNNWNWSILLHD